MSAQVRTLLEVQLDHLTELCMLHAPPAIRAPQPAPLLGLPPTAEMTVAASAPTEVPSTVAVVAAAEEEATEAVRTAKKMAQRARCEQRLLCGVRDEAGVVGAHSVEEILRALWRRTVALWDLRRSHGEMNKWETLPAVFEAIEAWGLRGAVLGSPSRRAVGSATGEATNGGGGEGGEADRALAMMRETRVRSELEYGVESNDAAKMRAMEALLAGYGS